MLGDGNIIEHKTESCVNHVIASILKLIETAVIFTTYLQPMEGFVRNQFEKL